MEKFKISDIQEIFATDVERFHSLTQNHLTHLLSEPMPSQESLDEALRQCHTLKGLAATVEAWGLSCLGADLEKLLELAGSWLHNEREKANGIFEFILDHMQDWYVMNQFTCIDMLPQAWDTYLGLRSIMEERWPGYLPALASAEAQNAHYVRLTDLQIAAAPAIPQTQMAESPAQMEPPTPDLDVQHAQPIAASLPNQSPTTADAAQHQAPNLSVPAPVRVVPPTLRHREEPVAQAPVENLDTQQSEPMAHVEKPAGVPSSPELPEASEHRAAAAPETGALPAAPKPLQAVPPSLRRRKEADPEAAAPVVPETVENFAAIVPPSVEQTAPPVATAAPPELSTLRSSATGGDVGLNAATEDGPPATVVPPVTATTEAAQQTAEAAPTAPPILRVATPALKRRAKKSETPKAPAVESTAAASPASSQPVAAESSATVPPAAEAAQTQSAESLSESLAAEDVFAALTPVDAATPSAEFESAAPVETQHPPTLGATARHSHGRAEAPSEGCQVPNLSVAGFKPTADADLLEMLGQEVTGYLAELSAHLTELAGNLSDAVLWEKSRRLFHTIKGTAATFNLEAVSSPAKAAEAHCIVAVEDAQARTREAFEVCVQRAHVVAKALGLPFAQQALRDALELGLAQAANVAAAGAGLEGAQVGQALDPEMAGFFIHDAREQIQVIERAVLHWEKGELPLEQVNAAQRGFHTIKGAANSIGLSGVGQSVHEVEAFLESVAASGAAGSRVLFTFLLGAVDQLRTYLADLARDTASPWRHDWRTVLALLGRPAAEAQAQGAGSLSASGAAGSAARVQAALESARNLAESAAADAAQSAESPASGEDAHYLRIEAERLYQLMNLIGEMVIDRARLARKLEQLTVLQRALAERNRALSESVQNFQEQFEFTRLKSVGGLRGNESVGGAAGSGVKESVGGAHGSPGEISQAGGQSVSSSGISRGEQSGEFSELEFDRYDRFNVLARSLVEISHDIEELHGEVGVSLETFASENVQFTQTSRELQRKVTGLSLVPVNTLFPRLQRAFRDALNVEGKEADLMLTGGEALLDKVVVDKVYGPLLHLLRNAVAHGIEDAVAREQRQKPARGQVRLSATPLSNQIVIQIVDDGAGVDAEAVRLRAVAKGWLPKEAPALTADQVVYFIFQPGFSTAAKVTSVSGRGIGLDVVRKEVENLNGSVELRFEAGVGSTWTLRLPLTLSISEAILANVGNTMFAFPLNFIESGLILDGPTTVGEDGRELFAPEVVSRAAAVEGGAPDAQPLGLTTETAEALPVVRLAKLFGLPGAADANKGLIVSVGERRVIVVVDMVLMRQEIVIKQLDSVMMMHPLLNGATLDPEGRVIPILNLPGVLKFAERQAEAGAAKELGETHTEDIATHTSTQRRVLIVDDSLSVRKVQERYLKDLGCAVTTAKDGLEALEKLREQDFEIIFTDLEMPRLNGYELITELHGNPAWAAIPVVVISSRGGDKYVTKAMNLGATTFLAKPFTQEQLRQVLEHYAGVGRLA